MGGTRFVGKAIVDELVIQNHQITLFTRGNKSIPSGVTHIKGDRDTDDLDKLVGKQYDIIIDSSGRNKDQTKRLIQKTGKPSWRYIYISSAGLYKNHGLYPFLESSQVDINSRHYGKAETENWLIENSIPFTSFRPTYIYGPGNYNPIEKWFFDRICYDKKIPIPDDGEILTQLGHVKDLAKGVLLSIENEVARNRIYNCTGKEVVSIKGLIEIFANVCGKKLSNLNTKSFDSSLLDPKARKLFPIRLSHFFTDVTRIERELSWKPSYCLFDGIKDSYQNDYLLKDNSEPDITIDSVLIN